MIPPLTSKVLNAFLYHDVGKEMRKNVNSFEKLYDFLNLNFLNLKKKINVTFYVT